MLLILIKKRHDIILGSVLLHWCPYNLKKRKKWPRQLGWVTASLILCDTTQDIPPPELPWQPKPTAVGV